MGRLVVECDDAPLGPGLRQELDVAAEALVVRVSRQDVQRPCHVLGQCPREDLAELLERRTEIRVVLVGVTNHQPGRQDDGHGLVLGQLQRGQELVGREAPATIVRPDGDADLALDRGEVAVDGPHRHVDPAGDVADRHAVRMSPQQRNDPGDPGQPVALA